MAGSAILASIEAAAAADDSGWSAAARSEELLELLAAQECLAALVQRKVGAWDRDQAWTLDDALSAVSWLVHRAPMTNTDAAVLVRTGRHVASYEATAKALDAGDISSSHTTIIARAVRHRESLYPEHEDTILAAARQLAPTEFRDVMRYWASCADDQLDRGRARGDLDGNYLDLTRTFGGSDTSRAASTRSALRPSKRSSTRWNPPTPRTRPSAATSRSVAPMR